MKTFGGADAAGSQPIAGDSQDNLESDQGMEQDCGAQRMGALIGASALWLPSIARELSQAHDSEEPAPSRS